jgi:ABC-2 type transport system ATP-binding protein
MREPLNPTELIQRGQAAALVGRQEEARQHLRRAVELDPQNVEAWLLLAGVEQDPLRKAVCFDTVLEIDPDHVQARLGLDLLRQSGAEKAVGPLPCPTTMIAVCELTKRYNHTLALDRLSLQVPRGSVFGLLGSNGAGKTTFLRLVMGFVFAEQGTIQWAEPAPCSIGYLPERAFYPPRFTVRGYLQTLARLAGLADVEQRQTLDRLLAQFGLTEVQTRRLGNCSRGMLQRVGLAQTLLGDPPLIILDEPVLGLDPAAQKLFREQILALHQAGKTVILSSHHLDHVTRVCTHVAVMDKGRLVRSGSLAEILSPQSQVVLDTASIPSVLQEQIEDLSPGIAVAERRIILTGPAMNHKAGVLRALLDAGVDLESLSEQHATLEEVYLEATGG